MDTYLIVVWIYNIGIWSMLGIRYKMGLMRTSSFRNHMLNTVFWPLGLIAFLLSKPVKVSRRAWQLLAPEDEPTEKPSKDRVVQRIRTQEQERLDRIRSITFWRSQLTSDSVIEQNLAKDMLAQVFAVPEVDDRLVCDACEGKGIRKSGSSRDESVCRACEGDGHAVPKTMDQESAWLVMVRAELKRQENA